MWPNPQFPADLVTFTEEMLNEKFHFLDRVINLEHAKLLGSNTEPYYSMVSMVNSGKCSYYH